MSAAPIQRPFHRLRKAVPLLALLMAVTFVSTPAAAADGPVGFRACRATYAGAPRGADKRVDVLRLLRQLKDLNADTYNWLVWHESTDWDDLKSFLPLANEQGVRVWVTIVPPSESPPKARNFSEPFRLDYGRWAKEIAELSVLHPHLVAWSIDDFTHNLRFFTPEKLTTILDGARQINPKLAFVPCCYFKGVTPKFAKAYAGLLDGVLFPYRNESGGANLTDSGAVAGEVKQIRTLLGPDVAVIVDVYSTGHSRLGNSTPEYVREVLTAGSTNADGIMVYCHTGRATDPKYGVIRDVFSRTRAAQEK